MMVRGDDIRLLNLRPYSKRSRPFELLDKTWMFFCGPGLNTCFPHAILLYRVRGSFLLRLKEYMHPMVSLALILLMTSRLSRAGAGYGIPHTGHHAGHSS
jgi:hypothetical protein